MEDLLKKTRVKKEDTPKVKEEGMKKEVNPSEGFLNESGLDFSDISSEKKREYTFPNGKKLKIEKPLFLNVSSSGGHRLYDETGYCYYVQPAQGWYIKWKVRKGKPNFVK